MDPQQGQPQPDLIIGQTIGNYLVTQKLGEGGMGAVYLAEHPSIGKKVALKVLHSEFSSNEDVVTRFFNEAKAVNNIGHPNIVDITDYGIIQGIGRDHLVYFIMEYLGGTTLTKVIRTESPFPPERALQIALQVADALAASHRCGIVHRDLKPDNIMLISRGRERDFVKLLDFGIAKLTGGAAGSRRTRTGIVMGTPAYMSPEQCDGRGNIDHRTDIYALGVVIYEMLAGRVPFLGEGYGEVLVQHLTQLPVPPSQFRMLNPHVEAVVMKALEKRVEMRYPTMEEMMRAMSDPVGFVESHGGLMGFMQTQLMPSTAPLPEIRLTPAPITGPMTGQISTPTAGMMTPHTLTSPVPGSGMMQSPVPTHLTPAPGVMTAPVAKSKLPLIIIGVLAVAAAVIVTVVMMGGGKSDKPSDPIASNDPPSGSAPSGSAKAAGTGSAEGSAKTVGSDATKVNAGTGSATPGSGSAPPVDSKFVSITITTTPPGAKIIINGQELTEKTGEPFSLLKSSNDVKVTVRLDRYEDMTFTIRPDGNLNLEKILVKKKSGSGTVPVRPGSGSAKTGSAKPGSGSAKQGSGNDTKLIKPGD